jgi:sugar phosphate permease
MDARVLATSNTQERIGSSIYPSTRVRWSNIAPTLLIIWMIANLEKGNISIVIADPKFLADLGLEHKHALLGWLTTGLIIAYGAAAPAWGLISGAIGARRAIMISLMLWGLVCVVSGTAATYGTLLASRILMGVAEAALYPVTLALVAYWFPLKERGRATAFWWVGTMIGPMVTGILTTSLIVYFGWRIQFYALGLLAVILPLPLAMFLLRDTPRQHPVVNHAELISIESGMIEENDDAPGRILRTKVSSWTKNFRYWLIVISIIFNSVFFLGWAVWLPTYLKTTRHFTFSKAGYLTFVIYGCATLTVLATGLFSDRIFRRAPIASAGWLFAGLFLICATLVSDRTACVIFMTLSLCAQQTGICGAQMLYHSVVGTHDMARSQGVATCFIQLLGSFSPVMIGYFLSAFSGDFTVAFIVLAGAVFAAAVCMAVLAWEGL